MSRRHDTARLTAWGQDGFYVRRDCMCPVVLTRGSDQMPVSTKFEMRDDDNVIRNYGRMLIELAAAIPDGLVCFFVSYSYMDKIVSKWHDMGVLTVKHPPPWLLMMPSGFNITSCGRMALLGSVHQLVESKLPGVVFCLVFSVAT